ncbi:hypothetical protein CEXT_361611 [Caerostris extrusa]|uniref:Uncharacterized protein n=1 Tax=Caerostris extrusa TaxID=172846 RepID=A0AAV4WEQ2_CAEEX|nr:hypothetical protein CEXT_361611 [Caerostris extrusa]
MENKTYVCARAASPRPALDHLSVAGSRQHRTQNRFLKVSFFVRGTFVGPSISNDDPRSLSLANDTLPFENVEE